MRTLRNRRGCYTMLFIWAFLPYRYSAFAEGYQFEAVYTGEILSNVSGGIKSGSRYLDNLDLTLDVDIAEAWGFGAGRLFIYGLYNNGNTFSDDLGGDLQVVSNIDAGHAWRVYEFWYEFGEGPWSIRTGLYDLNSEFDVSETGGLFLNSSHGMGVDFSQTGENGPSIFPVSSLTLRGAIQTDDFTVRIAVLDGVPGNPDNSASNTINLGGDDGVLTVAEMDARISESSRLWSGYWRYSSEFERPFSSGRTKGNDGWYVGVESRIEIGTLAVAGFVRYGQANEQLNAVEGYLGTGIVIDAPIVSRPKDQLGLAVASARLGEPYRNHLNLLVNNAQRREISWELTYRAQISKHLVIQPNIQFIQSPSVSSAIDDALVVGLRFEIVY
ncbi:MAG: carbohydrate porin [Pirellulaceae bacterium]|nr:carbohydrate porin [Pirellulaceae bacterium]